MLDTVRWPRHVEVRGPDRRRWRVGRRWVAWHPQVRRIRLRLGDATNVTGVLDDISAGTAIAVVALFLAVLTGPLAGVGVFFAEWMLALLLVPIAVGYRLLFHRPWLLYAEAADGRHVYVRSVVGWTAGEQAIAAATAQIVNSGYPPDGWIRIQ